MNFAVRMVCGLFCLLAASAQATGALAPLPSAALDATGELPLEPRGLPLQPSAADRPATSASAPAAPPAAGDRAPATSEPPTAVKPESGAAQMALYSVRINGQDSGDVLLIRSADGGLMASKADLEAWRLHLPQAPAMIFKDAPYYPLAAYQNSLLRVDEDLLQLTLDLPAHYFTLSLINEAPTTVVPLRPPYSGGFGNYDLYYSATNGSNGSNGSNSLNGAFEAGIFNQYGAGVTDVLAQNKGSAPFRMIRLGSTWTRDFPDEMKTLTLGDTVGNSGTWGRPLRFGGVRYGTNFATQPGFVKLPLPGLSGESALPSTTELFINGVLRQSGSLPPGPFQFNNLPVVTGDGTVRVVVRDQLGREQVISQSYYGSTLLLREGLTEESNEIGFVRNNYGINSNDYGRFVAAVQRSKGFTDTFTGEARAEVLGSQQTVGIGGSLAFPKVGLISAAIAASHNSSSGYGGLLLTSFERQSAEGVSFGLRSQSTTPQFTQMGQQPGQRAPARVSSANVGFSVGQFGSFGLGYAIQKNRDKPDAEVVSANYSLSVGKSSALIVSAYKSLIGEPGKAVSITLSIGLGEHSSVSFNAAKQKNSSQMVAQVQQNLPAGTGTGYRLLATVGDPSGRKEAGFSAQNDIGTYSVEAGHASGITSYRASASGGVAYLDGSAYLSRRLTGSFGVVQAPDFPDIGIFVSNQLVGRTDAKGNAIMPNLLAYQNNAVSIDANELPMDAQLDATQVNVVPYYRSGVLVKFPIQRVRSALLSIVLADGQPMPLGSEVSIAGREEAFLVAERGEVYVTGLAPEKNQLRASWEGQTCAFEVSLDKNLGPVPRIGPYTCSGVHP